MSTGSISSGSCRRPSTALWPCRSRRWPGLRGVRRAVEAAAEPSLHARVRIGYLTAVLSLDAGDVLHLSVSGVAGTTPTPVEQNVALALCFEPSEQLRLSARPGDVIPVVHFYLFPSPID